MGLYLGNYATMFAREWRINMARVWIYDWGMKKERNWSMKVKGMMMLW